MAFLLLSLFLSLRFEVGFDWYNYLDIYNNVGFELKDVGYRLLNDYFRQNYTYQGLVFCITIISSLSLLYFYCKKSINLPLALLFLLITNVWFYHWLFYRQALAIMILLIPFSIGVNKKILYVCFVLVASLFHSSALFLLPAIFIMNLKIRKRYYFYVFILFFYVSFF
ncbi:TPA: EpsG family protein, partial [Citrobacter sedlakii]